MGVKIREKSGRLHLDIYFNGKKAFGGLAPFRVKRQRAKQARYEIDGNMTLQTKGSIDRRGMGACRRGRKTAQNTRK
jgi:hypothetical protein